MKDTIKHIYIITNDRIGRFKRVLKKRIRMIIKFFHISISSSVISLSGVNFDDFTKVYDTI